MQPDVELVGRCQEGDQAAFAQLVDRYQKKVYNVAFRMLGDNEDARDLAQEAFLKAYFALPDFRGESTFGTWIYRITTNLCLDKLRQRKNQIVFSLDEPLQTERGEVSRQWEAEGDNPEEIAEQREFQEQLQRLIETLPWEQRAVLVLREFQGFSYEEIAVSLQCSLGTVKSRLSRARNTLKEKLLANGELFAGRFRQKEGKGGNR